MKDKSRTQFRLTAVRNKFVTVAEVDHQELWRRTA